MVRAFVITVSLIVAACSANAAWEPQEIQHLNGPKEPLRLPAESQIVTASWNRVVAVPYIVYMPEKDRLLMLVSCDYPHQAMILKSDDQGGSWSSPHFVHLNAEGKPDTGMGIGLTYLGQGKVLLVANRRWFSNDYGETWTDYAALSTLPDGKAWNGWDPIYVDRDPGTGAIKRLIETGYGMDVAKWESNGGPGYSTGHIHFSTDEGRTWSEGIKVPQWEGASEITMIRAQNGDLVAACRTDKPAHFSEVLDHYEGLAVSVSSDDGGTWSALNRLYTWGRHHPSLLRLPDGMLVMTYVVRKGYTDSPDGYPRFGIEAIVSGDNGRSWDLDHRYVLQYWTGNRQGPNGWWASCQATSSVLLPDGSILTAFGTGYRSESVNGQSPAPRDVGLVHWRLSTEVSGPAGEITAAAADSEIRNVFNPDILKAQAVTQPGK